MALILFWIKIADKRIIASLKSSPFMVVWIALVICVFVYGFANNYINAVFDAKPVFLVTPVFMFFSLLKSFKNYNLTPLLIMYSKSGYNNKIIYTRYFLKQAFLNNILFIIFNIIAYNSMTDNKYFVFIPGLTALSIFASFLIMYLKCGIVNRSITKKTGAKRKGNPVVKSIICDYLSFDFIALMVLCAALFIFLTVEFAKDAESFFNLYSNYGFLILITSILSVGFMGILESIPKINWKFQAIISKNDYKYHLKRTVIFIGIAYGWLLAPFFIYIIAGSIIYRIILLKYLLCLFVIFFAVINIAFTVSHILIKGIKSLLVIALTMWFSALSVYHLIGLFILIFITFIKAKNEYGEWSLQ